MILQTIMTKLGKPNPTPNDLIMLVKFSKNAESVYHKVAGDKSSVYDDHITKHWLRLPEAIVLDGIRTDLVWMSHWCASDWASCPKHNKKSYLLWETAIFEIVDEETGERTKAISLQKPSDVGSDAMLSDADNVWAD